MHASPEEVKDNYPCFRAFVNARLKEDFRRIVAELPHTDLETMVRTTGAQPLEAFIDSIERPAESAS